MNVGKAAIIGGGLIGGGWLARLIEAGTDVAVYDPSPDAEAKLTRLLERAERAQAKLTLAPRPRKGSWRMAASAAQACSGAAWVVESVPERPDIKRRAYAEIEAGAAPEALVTSSTSGILPSELQAEMTHPERFLVAHPFNPVYLLPLVELVPGDRTAPETVERARALTDRIGMYPLVLTREIEAFVADRLMEALWREALWLVHDGIATAAEVDDAVRYGCGLRWAQMGTFQTFNIAGGEAGMRHFLAQFGPALKWPWTKLMDVPEMDDALIDRIAGQVEDQAAGRTVDELERIRDDNLVAILQALRSTGWGAGETLAAHERKLFAATETPEQDFALPFQTVDMRIPADWTDYNGHMNESRYGQVFSDAADGTMRAIGADQAYIARGLSFFTVEIHIRFLEEARVGERIRAVTQVLEGRGKKMHLFHRMEREDGTLLATGEQMLIHVSLETRAACDPAPEVAARLADIAAAHATLPLPEGAGRAVGQKR